MSTNTTPNTKRNTTSDVDSILPLLFAANPIATLNYKKMSEMDTQGRTAYALEHKFRKWRQAGKKILETHSDGAGGPNKASKASVARLRGGLDSKSVNGAQKGTAQEEDSDGDEDVEAIDAGIKAEIESSKDELTPQTAKAKAKTTAGNKRAATEEAGSTNGEESPSKKARVIKKGTAQVVKKPKAKKRSAMNDDFEGEFEEEEAKGKDWDGNGKAASAQDKKAVAKKENGGRLDVEETPLVPMIFDP